MTGERPAGYSCATTSVLILAPALSPAAILCLHTHGNLYADLLGTLPLPRGSVTQRPALHPAPFLKRDAIESLPDRYIKPSSPSRSATQDPLFGPLQRCAIRMLPHVYRFPSRFSPRLTPSPLPMRRYHQKLWK